MPFDGSVDGPRLDALQKLDRVIGLLSHQKQWCRQRLRTHDGRHCIQGALMEADATETLRQPILAAIRQVTGRDYAKVEMFNDQPLTTHALVLAVLQQAQRNLVDHAIAGSTVRCA